MNIGEGGASSTGGASSPTAFLAKVYNRDTLVRGYFVCFCRLNRLGTRVVTKDVLVWICS